MGRGANPDHERVEELLAGYALLALSGEDALEADRLLAEHVPSCLTCRGILSEFQGLAGELALAADPVPPPDLALERIRRGIDDVPLAGGPSRRRAFVALAASVVALVAIGGLSFAMATRAWQAEDTTTTALEVIGLMRSPGVSPVSVGPEGSTPSGSGFVEISAPQFRRLYLVADACPEPAPGRGYQLWLGEGGAFTPVGDVFRPDDGRVLLELVVEVSRYDEIWITEEVLGTRPDTPGSAGGHSWRAPLA